MFDCVADRLLLRYVVIHSFPNVLILFWADNPTAKFGEALRGQVEERLEFFEKGTPPSKNADAIRKVLDELAEEEVDVEMDGPALTTLELSPKKEKKKKRKSDAMDVDDDDEPSPKKKAKLSKEEKKALKKAEKEKAKKEGAEAVRLIFSYVCIVD